MIFSGTFGRLFFEKVLSQSQPQKPLTEICFCFSFEKSRYTFQCKMQCKFRDRDASKAQKVVTANIFFAEVFYLGSNVA